MSQVKNEEVKNQAPAPAKSTVRMVKMKALYPVRMSQVEIINGEEHKTFKHVQPGSTFTCSEEEAKVFEQVVEGHHSFGGERYEVDGEVRRHKLQTAVRI